MFRPIQVVTKCNLFSSYSSSLRNCRLQFSVQSCWFNSYKKQYFNTSISPETKYYETQIENAVKEDNLAKIESMVKSYSNSPTSKQIGPYYKAMLYYNKINDFKKFHECLNEMFDQGLEANTEIWNLILSIQIKSGDKTRIMETWNNIPSKKSFTYFLLFRYYLSLNDQADAHAILQAMLQNHIFVTFEFYLLLLNYYAKCKNFEKFDFVFKQMIHFKIHPSSRDAALLLNTLESVKQIEKAIQFIHTIPIKEMTFPLVRKIIHILIENHYDNEAFDILKKLSENNFNVEAGIFSVVINEFFERKDYRAAEKLIHYVSTMNVPPTVDYYNCLVSNYANLGDFAKITDLFGSMMENKVSPNIVTNNIIQRFQLGSYWAAAGELLNKNEEKVE